MTYANLRLEIEDDVALLTINHPPANALNQTTLQELQKVLDELEQDNRAKAVVVTGEGRFFIAGADIKEFLQLSVDQAQALSENGQRLFDRMEAFPKPIIAAINGACLGGGLELALACHIRLAAPEAKLGLPELNLGLIPGYGGTQRLPQVVGRGKATQMILTSEMIGGEEALRIGLIESLYPLDQLVSEAKTLAKTIAQKSSVTMKFALAAIHAGFTADRETGLREEARLFGQSFATEDCKEGVNAFIEKRKPQFTNR